MATSAATHQKDAFTTFCEIEYPHLVGTLALLLSDRWLAEDLAQEALARTWLRWQRVSGLERPDLWTRRVAVNLAHSAWRRRGLAGREQQPTVTTAVASDDAASLRLHEALAQLTPRQRTAVTLRFFSDLPVADTAAVMGCKPGTVKALTSQGVARLRAALLLPPENARD